MNRLRLPLLAGLALAVLLPFTMVEPAVARGPAPFRPLTARQVAHRLTGEVYGFLPYWLETSRTAGALHYDLLTTVAFFDLGLKSNGAVDRTTPGYRALTNPSANAIIAAAHAAGVRVDLTVASFGFLKNRAFLRNPAAQKRAIRQLVAIMRVRGLDGVALDFEGVYLRDLPAFGRFVGDVGRAVRAYDRIGRVTVAVGASVAGLAMAETALTARADRVLIMGYDYRGGQSTSTGSTDPLVRRDGGMSLTWTLNLYRAAHVPMNRVVLALPYYGVSWPTASARMNTIPKRAAYGAAPPYSIRVSKVQVPRGAPRGYDPVEASAWVAIYDARLRVWRQTYWDSPLALAAKYALARSRGLAGVGLWALGYDNGSAGNWQAIAKAFRPVVTPKPHHVPRRIHKPKHVNRQPHAKTTKTIHHPIPARAAHAPRRIAV